MALEPLRATLYDLKTGSYLRRIPITKAPWSKELNRWGRMEVTVPETAAANLPLLRSMAQPWRTLLVLSRGSRLIQYGPITKRPYGDRLVLKGEGFGAVFRKRLVLNRALRGMTLDGEILIDEDNPAPEWKLDFRGSYVDIATRLVRETREWGTLPVSTPALAGGPMRRVYYGYDFATVEERLLQLTQLEGGPELRFTAIPRAGGVSFQLQGGDELVNNRHRWNTGIPGDRCSIGNIDDDGENIVTEQWSLGGRNEDLLLVAREDDGSVRSAAVNLFPDPRYARPTGIWMPVAVKTTPDTVTPEAVDDVQHWGVHMYEPENNDSYVSAGGDGGGMRLGMQAGKTYVISAEGSVRSLMSGDRPAEADASGGQKSRTRSIVVHSRVGSGPYSIWHSPQVPNVAESEVRTSVRFTLPAGTTEAFVRFYHGGTKGTDRKSVV